MGCNESGVISLESEVRRILLGNFAIAMKAKLDAKDSKYPPGTKYTMEDLWQHMKKEYDELWIAYIEFKQYASPLSSTSLHHMEAECIDVANMAFIIREECIRLRGGIKS